MQSLILSKQRVQKLDSILNKQKNFVQIPRNEKTQVQFEMKTEIEERVQLLKQQEEHSYKKPVHLNLEEHLKVYQNVAEFKISSKFQWILLKDCLTIWREKTVEKKLLNDKIAREADTQNQAHTSLADQMVKKQMYKQFDKMKSNVSNVSKTHEHNKDQQNDAAVSKIHNDPTQLFKVPSQALLKYIPFCSDIYLGID